MGQNRAGIGIFVEVKNANKIEKVRKKSIMQEGIHVFHCIGIESKQDKT
jgi:hypothetical protein